MTQATAGQPESKDDTRPGLFDGGIGEDWSHIAVERIEPIEERGFLGNVECSITEPELLERFGGGKFQLRGKRNNGKVVGNTTVTIAGDPIFTSDTNRRIWQARMARTGGGLAPAAAAPQQQGIGLADIMALMSAQQQQQAQVQAQLIEQQREDRRLREEERRQIEADRRRDDEAREKRRDAELAESRRRDQEFTTTLITMVTASAKQSAPPVADPVGILVQGMALAQKFHQASPAGRDDDDDDDGKPAEEDDTAQMVKGAVRGIMEMVTQSKAAAAPAGAPAQVAQVADQPGTVTITGPLGAKLEEFVQRVQRSGKNPEALIASAVDIMDRTLTKQAAPAAATGAAEQAPAAVVPVAPRAARRPRPGGVSKEERRSAALQVQRAIGAAAAAASGDRVPNGAAPAAAADTAAS